MSKTIMSPDHPERDEFISQLIGHLAEGTCTDRIDRPYATTILKAMGNIDVEGSLSYFDSIGGYCDCEILFILGVPFVIEPIDLLSDSGRELCLNIRVWGKVLDLVFSSGWIPLEVERTLSDNSPQEPEEAEEYWAYDFQDATPQDAANIADTIQAHLDKGEPNKKWASLLIEVIDFLRGGGFSYSLRAASK